MENTKIILPEDKSLVDKLKKKRIEYTKRIEKNFPGVYSKYSSSLRNLYVVTSVYYKLSILSEVLDFRKIEKSKITKDLYDYEGKFFLESFNKSWEVIKDYCLTGGRNILGGTGL